MKASEFVARINELAHEIGGDPEIVVESEYCWRSCDGYEPAAISAVDVSDGPAGPWPAMIALPDGGLYCSDGKLRKNTQQVIAITEG